MLLAKLYQLSQRDDIKPRLPIEGYSKVRNSWLIQIDGNGKLLKIISDGEEGTKKGTYRSVPDLIRASNIKPKLLADNGEYVLGIAKKVGDRKVPQRHQAFKELVKQCADATKEESALAVARFLDFWQPEVNTDILPPDFDPSANVTFMVNFPDGRSVIPADSRESLTEIQNFWADLLSGEPSESNTSDRPILTCLVTGEQREVEERLPVKIKGIPNGQTAGTALVSANAPPFESYGLSNCLTSPICREAGEGFAKALNYLIGNDDSHFKLNHSILYVFWTKNRSDDPNDYNNEDFPSTIKEHLRSIYTTERSYGVEENRFYALGLSASGGRAVVRDWIDLSLAERSRNLERWFEGQEIVNKYGQWDEKPYLSIRRLSASLVRDPKEEEKSVNRMMPRLVRAAFKGESLPLEMLSQLVRRNSAERDVTRERAALMKLVLATQENYQESMKNMQSLNEEPELKDPGDRAAYHCGRLLAQLERIQETALGREVNATLIDRFYGAASTTPGKVFGGLIKDAQAHLSRIRKDKRPTYEALQQKIAEITINISPEPGKLPNNFTLQQQTIFGLGYYHQRAQNYKEAMEAKETKAQKSDTSAES